MNVTIKRDGQYIKGIVLDLSPVEGITVMTALDCLHKDGGRNELDRIASKEMRKEISNALSGA